MLSCRWFLWQRASPGSCIPPLRHSWNTPQFLCHQQISDSVIAQSSPCTHKSAVYRLKKRRAIPWGASVLLNTVSDMVSFSLTSCCLLLRYLEIQVTRHGSTLILISLSWSINGWMVLNPFEKSKKRIFTVELSLYRWECTQCWWHPPHILHTNTCLITADGPGHSTQFKNGSIIWSRHFWRTLKQRFPEAGYCCHVLLSWWCYLLVHLSTPEGQIFFSSIFF